MENITINKFVNETFFKKMGDLKNYTNKKYNVSF
jgi:hypothetical protein